MSSPYESRVQFLLEGPSSELFHEMEGILAVPSKGSHVYFNNVGYKVKSVVTYLYDIQYTNPISGGAEWAMDYELYKVVLSVLP